MSADYRLRRFDCTDCIAPVGFADKRSVYRSIICAVYGIVLLRAVKAVCVSRGAVVILITALRFVRSVLPVVIHI